jgi:hypothetical protein
MKIWIWDIENHHIILSEDEIWVISFFLWQLINLLIMKIINLSLSLYIYRKVTVICFLNMEADLRVQYVSFPPPTSEFFGSKFFPFLGTKLGKFFIKFF